MFRGPPSAQSQPILNLSSRLKSLLKLKFYFERPRLRLRSCCLMDDPAECAFRWARALTNFWAIAQFLTLRPFFWGATNWWICCADKWAALKFTRQTSNEFEFKEKIHSKIIRIKCFSKKRISFRSVMSRPPLPLNRNTKSADWSAEKVVPSPPFSFFFLSTHQNQMFPPRSFPLAIKKKRISKEEETDSQSQRTNGEGGGYQCHT